MYDIIIIGAGPSGLTAALYALRANKKVLIFEKSNYGGQIINTLNIENYPSYEHISGYDLATKLYNQVKSLGAEFKYEEVIKINKKKEVTTSKDTYKAKAIIISTGLKSRNLNIENEKDLIGKGISYCATCDGAFYKNKTVAVVGGGNTAVEEALYLTDIAKKVYLIHRRDTFTSDESTLNKLKEKNNIEFIYNSNVTKLNSKEKLESIQVTDSKQTTKEIKIDGLFVAIGKIPQNEVFSKIIKLDDNGYIITNKDYKTNIDGIYASGDCINKKIRQIVTATNDGAIASINAVKYINKKVQ